MRFSSYVFLISSISHFLMPSSLSLGTMETSHPIIKQPYLKSSFFGRIFSLLRWIDQILALCVGAASLGLLMWWHHVVKVWMQIKCSQSTLLMLPHFCSLSYQSPAYLIIAIYLLITVLLSEDFNMRSIIFLHINSKEINAHINELYSTYHS